jgi:hypothetical protein
MTTEITKMIQKARLNLVVRVKKHALDLFNKRDASNFPVLASNGPYAGLVFGPHEANNDEANLTAADRAYAGNFSKCLRHNPSTGIVEKAHYEQFRNTLRTLLARNSETKETNTDAPALGEIDAILASAAPGVRKFTNPLAGLATDLEGIDPVDIAIPPAPALASEVAAKELVELYWMALLRDVPFSQWSSSPLAGAAVTELNSLNTTGDAFAQFYMQSGSGAATWDKAIRIDRLFRGSAKGNDTGYYVSQFLLQDVGFGTLTINQRQKTAVPNLDYMTWWDEWVATQSGVDRSNTDVFDGTHRYIRTLRDLATYVHFDALHEAYFNAALILLGHNAKLSSANPYTASGRRQVGFGTLGGPHLLVLVSEVATRALKAMWMQKWFVHRRLRPEAIAGRVDLAIRDSANYGTLVHDKVKTSNALQKVQTMNASHTALLPMAFPEGSPTHPSYGAGHATVAGACVTVLKAWFDTTQHLHDFMPVIRPSDEGLTLEPANDDVTVGGELHKLAANVAIGRNAGGVHYRSDYAKSLALGEAIATAVLQEQSLTLREDHTWKFETFSGDTISVHDGEVKRLP